MSAPAGRRRHPAAAALALAQHPGAEPLVARRRARCRRSPRKGSARPRSQGQVLRQFGHRRVDARAVLSAHHDIGTIDPVRLERVATDRQIREAAAPAPRGSRRCRPRRASPAASARAAARRRSGSAGRWPPSPRNTAGTPAMTCTLPQGEARRRRDRVVDQRGALRDARHAQPRRVQLEPGRGVMGHQQRARIVAHVDGHVEGRGDAVGGDVVMGRADPAGGEDVIEAARQRARRLR